MLFEVRSSTGCPFDDSGVLVGAGAIRAVVHAATEIRCAGGVLSPFPVRVAQGARLIVDAGESSISVVVDTQGRVPANSSHLLCCERGSTEDLLESPHTCEKALRRSAGDLLPVVDALRCGVELISDGECFLHREHVAQAARDSGPVPVAGVRVQSKAPCMDME